MNLESRNSPRIDFFFVEFHIVLVIGQTLPVAIKPEMPRPRLRDRLFEVRSKPSLRDSSHPIRLPSAALETISTHEGGVILFQVAESGHINPVRSSSANRAIFTPRNNAAGTAPLDMVHYVVTQFATRIRQPIRKLRSR